MSLNISDKSYDVEALYANFYGGGDVAWTKDGKWFFCLNGSEITKVDVQTGLVADKYGLNVVDIEENEQHAAAEEDEDDTIYCFDVSPNQQYLVTVHRSSLIRLWNVATKKVEKLWKSQHKGPVVKIVFNADGKLVCTSGSDSSLRIWDYANNRCICALREFTGPSTLLKFHPNCAVTQIFAVGSDNAVYQWNYDTKVLIKKMKGHLSQVTGMAFSDATSDCANICTVSRDKVLIIWRLSDGKQLKVIPMYEELVGVAYCNADKIIVAGSLGNLKTVCCNTSKISTLLEGNSVATVAKDAEDDEADKKEHELTMLINHADIQQLAVVTADHNILIYQYSDDAKEALKCLKQLIGFNDEILDICFLGETEDFLAVATNSKNIKLYNLAEDMNCKVIKGHSDTVMTLSSPGASDLLLSAGKDFSLMLWKLNADNLECIAKNLNSHTSTIGCISFACNSAQAFASVCQSGSLKVWSLKKNPKKAEQEYQFIVNYAAAAHDKEINGVAFSPNNKLIATASQDKTAKLWSAESHVTMGTLRGHTRGVWCVRFSPTDQIVLTTSSDCTLRLWALSNLSCLKTFEQDSTVLRAEFIDHGKYLISAGSDGLLKVWNIKNNVCVQTLDKHDDRIWSLAISQKTQKFFFTAAADSKLIKWRDTTEENRNEEIDKRQANALEEQSLQSLLHLNKNMKKAFRLALKLNKPKVSYKILSQFVRSRDVEGINDIVSELNTDQLHVLLDQVKIWLCNSRTSHVANVVLNAILTEALSGEKPEFHRKLFSGGLVEKITPYVERHYKRITELNKEIQFLEFIVSNMEMS